MDLIRPDSTPNYDESPFFREWQAANHMPNQLPISAVCNSNCIFCSNKLNPFPIIKGFFREIDDVKFQLSVMQNHNKPIRMSDSIPGRISEGEALLHPKIFEILSVVRRKYPLNLLCLTTNGTMLDSQFIKALSRFRPIEINISLHTTKPELLSKIMRKSHSEVQCAINSTKLINENRLELAGSIVILPNICGWSDIENTVVSLRACGAKRMIFYWPGYNRFTASSLRNELFCSFDDFTKFVSQMRIKHAAVPIISAPDVELTKRLPIMRILARTLKGNPKTGCGTFMQVLWLVSEASYFFIKGIVSELSSRVKNAHHIVAVKNRTYGGNIIVAGLLMVDDFIQEGKKALKRFPKTDLVLIPKTPFDSYARDLQKKPAYILIESFRRPVWIVDESGRINPLLDRLFYNKDDPSPEACRCTMQEFNQFWIDASRLEKSLDVVASFPVLVNGKLLSREQYGKKLIAERRSFSTHSQPLVQNFDQLDSDHVLCLETWPTLDPSNPQRRWIFLMRKQARWQIERVSYRNDDKSIF